MDDERRKQLVEEIMQSNKCIFVKIQEATTPAWIQLDLTMAQIKGLFSLARVGTSTVGDLADSLGVGRPAASILVDRLFNHGLVEREEDDVDRRRTFVRLSPEGEQLVEQLRSGREDLFRGWLRQMDDSNLAALGQAMLALREIVGKDSPVAC